MKGITLKRLREWKRIIVQKNIDTPETRTLLTYLTKECKEIECDQQLNCPWKRGTGI